MKTKRQGDRNSEKVKVMQREISEDRKGSGI